MSNIVYFPSNTSRIAQADQFEKMIDLDAIAGVLNSAPGMQESHAATPLTACSDPSATTPITIGDDLIFAAIDAHCAALADHLIAIDAEAEIEEKWCRDEQRYEAQMQAASNRTRRACEAADAVAMTFLNIQPTTVAGAAALLNYVGAAGKQTFPELDHNGERMRFESEVIRHMGKALTAVARA